MNKSKSRLQYLFSLTVSVLLGHADVSTTLDLYVHPGIEHKRQCINKMLKSLGR